MIKAMMKLKFSKVKIQLKDKIAIPKLKKNYKI